MKLFLTSRFTSLFKPVRAGALWLWNHPLVLVLAVTLLIVSKVIFFGRLVYGDIPFFSVNDSVVNATYAWGSEQLGTSVRQSLNTLRDVVIAAISFHDEMYYFIKYVLPIILIPVTYFFILKKLGVKHRGALVLGALFPLFTPIVFGDFLTGQTFWVYLTVPWVVYYAIRLYCFKEFTLQHNLLLALWLFASLGMLPPIIVPLIVAVMGLAFVMLIADLLEKKLHIQKYLLSALVVGGVFFLLAAPYLLVASSGQASFTPPSLLGDYYHNYAQSGFANTLRLAGNNGNGQATLDYNITSINNIAGYALLAGIIFGAFVVGLQRADRRYRTLMIGIFAIGLPILGFMNLLNTNTVFGVKVFESQWIVSTVRSPSKLYNLLLPAFVILFAFALEQLMQHSKRQWQKAAVASSALLLLGLYGWPALRGDLGLLYGREDKLSNYKPDLTVEEAITHAPTKHTRSLLMPADHRDELNYQYRAPGFNLLRLEGGVPSTTTLMDGLNETLNTKNRYFFNYASTAGVENVVVQKDEAAYEDALFGLYPVDWLPEQTRDFVAGGMKQVTETPYFWQFSNPQPAPLVYSPPHLVQVKGSDELQTKAPFLNYQSAVIDQDVPGFEASTTAYEAKKQTKEGEVINGKAQLHDPQLLTLDVYSRYHEGRRQLVFDVVNPVNASIAKTITHDIPEDASVAMMGNEQLVFGEIKKRISLYAGDYDITFGALEPMPLSRSNPSFETTSPPAVFDATPRGDGKADIYAKTATDATHGEHSVLLGSKNHTAFITKDISVDDANSDYVLSFDYKNLHGNAGSFTVMNGKNTVLEGSDQLKKDAEWQNHQAFVAPRSQGAATLRAYFYTANNQTGVSENLFDNLRLHKIHDRTTAQLSLPAYEPDYDISNYRYSSALQQTSGNLLQNASFEDKKLWGQVGDASKSAPGTAKIKAGQSGDAAAGNHSLELSSENHTAFASQSVSSFEKNSVYTLSFRYKHVSGRKPGFAIWQDGAKLSAPAQQLKEGKDWTLFETTFVPSRNATNLTLYFYSYSNGEHTVNLFDDVRLERTSPIKTFLHKTANAEQPLEPLVQSYRRHNPTLLTLNMKPGRGMVILNESYHQGWKAYIVPQGAYQPGILQSAMLRPPGVLIKDHLMVNGFANGWLVDSNKYPELHNKDYTVVLQYDPQKLLYGGFALSGATLLLVSGYFVYQRRWSWRARRK